MGVGGGGGGLLVGNTVKPNPRTKFFLISPELARLAEDAKEVAGTSLAKEGTHDHTFSTSAILIKRNYMKNIPGGKSLPKKHSRKLLSRQQKLKTRRENTRNLNNKRIIMHGAKRCCKNKCKRTKTAGEHAKKICKTTLINETQTQRKIAEA